MKINKKEFINARYFFFFFENYQNSNYCAWDMICARLIAIFFTGSNEGDSMNSIKILLTMSLLVQISTMQAMWVITKITNQSDLVFVQAARGDNNTEIASISEKLKNPTQANVINLQADALFGSSGGCKIIAQTPAGNTIAIAFFGDPTHRVANGRAHYADLDCRNAAALTKSAMMARVFMVQGGSMKLIGFAGYEESNQSMALTLTGSAGNYQVALS